MLFVDFPTLSPSASVDADEDDAGLVDAGRLDAGEFDAGAADGEVSAALVGVLREVGEVGKDDNGTV